jgi:subfamily B ATP-binding cassette protein MsbA
MSVDKDQINNGGQIYVRLLKYVRPFKLAFILACLGLMLNAATDTGLAMVIKPIIDGVFVEKNDYWIRLIPFLLLGLALVRGGSAFMASFLMNGIGRQVIKELRRQAFERLLLLPSAFYDRSTTGQLLSKMTYDVEQVAQAATQAITVLIRDTLTIVGLLGWMFFLSWKLTLSFLLISPAVAVLIFYVNRRFRRISTHIQNSMGDVAHITEEAIAGQRIIKIFGGQQQEQQRFEVVNDRNRRQYMKLIATREGSLQIIQLIAALSIATIVFLATLPSMLESIKPGIFMSFVAAMMMLLSPLKRLTTVNAEIQKGIAAANSIFTLLDSEIELDTGQQSLTRAQGRIEYRHVSFSYGRGDGGALDDINLVIEPGQTVAFVGHSGSGKTTLVNLLPRFLPLKHGTILLDDHDISNLKLTDLRRQIALVGQDVVLFNDNIATNICYGDAIDQQRLTEAAQAAHALEFIERLPLAMETQIGEKGVLLSGGQRQRLAIARALYKNAPLLILDEATSALDSESERHIQQALEQLIKGRTTLVIAHRLSTIQKADQIVVLQDGRIIETGRHDELLARGGVYARLYQVQFNEPAVATAT